MSTMDIPHWVSIAMPAASVHGNASSHRTAERLDIEGKETCRSLTHPTKDAMQAFHSCEVTDCARRTRLQCDAG